MRYLAHLGVPSVSTTFIAPGDCVASLEGEVVVKPNISSGARDTGRFSPAAHAGARALIERIHASGRVALVQPYLPAVDRQGETALIFIGAELSHVVTKRAVLRGDGVAPVAEGELAVAAAMLEDDLVRVGTADRNQHAVAKAIHEEVCAQFGVPVYARIDLISGLDGRPILLELEAIEPSLYLALSPGASQRLAKAAQTF